MITDRPIRHWPTRKHVLVAAAVIAVIAAQLLIGHWTKPAHAGAWDPKLPYIKFQHIPKRGFSAQVGSNLVLCIKASPSNLKVYWTIDHSGTSGSYLAKVSGMPNCRLYVAPSTLSHESEQLDQFDQVWAWGQMGRRPVHYAQMNVRIGITP